MTEENLKYPNSIIPKSYSLRLIISKLGLVIRDLRFQLNYSESKVLNMTTQTMLGQRGRGTKGGNQETSVKIKMRSITARPPPPPSYLQLQDSIFLQETACRKHHLCAYLLEYTFVWVFILSVYWDPGYILQPIYSYNVFFFSLWLP